MTKTRHALQKRDYYTCSECIYIETRENKPFCTRANDFNRWNCFKFGCGEYGARDGPIEAPTLEFYGIRGAGSW